MEALSSERLSYEKIVGSHAPELTHALCDPRVYEFIDMACPSADELEASLSSLETGPPPVRADEFWFDYAVRRNADGRCLGRIEATVIGPNAEVAYLFGPEFWGHGYAGESLGWLQTSLSIHPGATSFWASIHPANERSLQLVERFGYKEVPEEEWPRLTTYDPGDRVFRYDEGSSFPVE